MYSEEANTYYAKYQRQWRIDHPERFLRIKLRSDVRHLLKNGAVLDGRTIILPDEFDLEGIV